MDDYLKARDLLETAYNIDNNDNDINNTTNSSEETINNNNENQEQILKDQTDL